MAHATDFYFYDMNLATLPDRRAAAAPHAPAVADDQTDLDNAAFLDVVQRAAGALRQRGVRAGDVVGIMLPNRAAFVVALFATCINDTMKPSIPIATVTVLERLGCRVVYPPGRRVAARS